MTSKGRPPLKRTSCSYRSASRSTASREPSVPTDVARLPSSAALWNVVSDRSPRMRQRDAGAAAVAVVAAPAKGRGACQPSSAAAHKTGACAGSTCGATGRGVAGAAEAGAGGDTGRADLGVRAGAQAVGKGKRIGDRARPRAMRADLGDGQRLAGDRHGITDADAVEAAAVQVGAVGGDPRDDRLERGEECDRGGGAHSRPRGWQR
jgi:hypothetical protein